MRGGAVWARATSAHERTPASTTHARYRLVTRELLEPEHLLHRAVGDGQRAIDDGKPFAQLRVCDREGRIREEVIPAHEREQALVTEESAQRGHLRLCAV